MAFFLNIDTAQDTAHVSLADDYNVVRAAINDSQKDHAAWIQPAIDEILRGSGCKMRDIRAVGVSNGPGSYTGLRIGLSTGKGLCYALGIPLITVGTLEVMAFTAIRELQHLNSLSSDDRMDENAQLFVCPMIDARRMEVFTAVYNVELVEIIPPHATVVGSATFEELLKRQKILFLGNGSTKFQRICQNTDNAIFKSFPLNPSALATITYRNFIGNNFAVLAYTEPLYLKEFFTMKTAELKKPEKGL